MSGKLYDINETVFLIDEYTYAYVLLADDKQRNQISKNIQKLLDQGLFDDAVKHGELDEYKLEDSDFDWLEYAMSYVGSIETALPDRAKQPIKRYADTSDANGEYFAYLQFNKQPDLFTPPYANPEDALDEIKTRLAEHDVILPDDYDWWAHIVKLKGSDYF